MTKPPLPIDHHLPYGAQVPMLRFLDFFDANIGLIPFGVTDTELAVLPDVVMATAAKCDTPAKEFSLRDVVERILREETRFDLNRYTMYLSATGARGAILNVLDALVSDDKPFVGFASPNWGFAKLVEQIPTAVGRPFHAITADQFVEQFEAVANDRMAALIIVDPSNPLGYSLTPAQVSHIEDVAARYGIVPIFDDVFRGMKPKGERHAVSEQTHGSIIVETTSKRFGVRGMGVTWTLIPKEFHDITPKLSVGCDGCENTAAIVTSALYETGYGARIAETVAQASAAYRRGFEEALTEAPYGLIVQAFPTMPIMTCHFRHEGVLNSLSLANVDHKILGVTSGVEWICPSNVREPSREELLHGLSYVRICPTKETPDRAYFGGRLLGEYMEQIHQGRLVIKEAPK